MSFCCRSSCRLASVPLGSYTPIKATIFNTNFELGVTRTSTPPTPISLSSPIVPVKYQAPPPPPPPRSKHSSLTNGTSITSNNNTTNTTANNTKRPAPTMPAHQPHPVAEQLLHFDTNGTKGIDADSLPYLKPASDEQTVAWSEGASDLLF